MAKLKKVETKTKLKHSPKRKSSKQSVEQSASATNKNNVQNANDVKEKTSGDTIALVKSQQKKVTQQTKKIKKGLKDGSIIIKQNRKEAKQKAEENRGLVYIGHIPHGFYEDEMKKYFKQFGKVTNIKICRSRISGKSKGYGYIEFEHPEVAKIAAETMNNYLMFKKRIVTEFVPFEKRPQHLFHGKSSNEQHTSVISRRGKQKHSRNKIQDETTVTKKAKRSYKRLQSKIGKLKNLGIQCNLIPTDVSDEVLAKIKIEKSSSTNVSSDKNFDSKSTKSKTTLTDVTNSNHSSKKSITQIKSKKPILTKSLDSVKTILMETSDSRDEGTQTTKVKNIKLGKTSQKRGVSKKKDKPMTLNSTTIKKIARELIRKRGKPLLTLKPKAGTKKK